MTNEMYLINITLGKYLSAEVAFLSIFPIDVTIIRCYFKCPNLFLDHSF